MIYIGGMHEKSLIELHDMRFIIAENILDITNIIASNNIFIHLHSTDDIQEFEFVCRYVPIGKK